MILPPPSARTPAFLPLDLAPGFLPLVSIPPTPGCRVCVTIPARDEAENIGATLEAFAGQLDANGGQPYRRDRFEILLLANNCGDQTAAVARRTAARFPGLVVHVVETTTPSGDAHVGAARRRLMDEAYRRLYVIGGRPRGIIATTDADTTVAPDWLAMTEREIARGAEAVGGNIRPCPRGLAALVSRARRLERQDTMYRLLATHLEHLIDPDPADPWPRHYHHFGGSLAVTAEAYARVGGLPPLPALEDVAFYQALRRHDVAFRHSPAVRVLTSARCDGRAPHGLSATLRRWSETTLGPDGDFAAGEHQVESVEALESRIQRRQELRRLWSTRDQAREHGWQARTAVVARALGLETSAVVRELRAASTFGAVYERLLASGSPAQGVARPLTEVDATIGELRVRLTELRAGTREAPPGSIAA